MHLIKNQGQQHPLSSEITPREAFEQRRLLLRGLSTAVAGTALATWAGREAMAQTAAPGKLARLASVPSRVAGAMTMEKASSYQDASTYNNYYEFGTDKADPAKNAGSLRTRP